MLSFVIFTPFDIENKTNLGQGTGLPAPNYTAVQYKGALFPPHCYPRLINPGTFRLTSIEKGSRVICTMYPNLNNIHWRLDFIRSFAWWLNQFRYKCRLVLSVSGANNTSTTYFFFYYISPRTESFRFLIILFSPPHRISYTKTRR